MGATATAWVQNLRGADSAGVQNTTERGATGCTQTVIEPSKKKENACATPCVGQRGPKLLPDDKSHPTPAAPRAPAKPATPHSPQDSHSGPPAPVFDALASFWHRPVGSHSSAPVRGRAPKTCTQKDALYSLDLRLDGWFSWAGQA